MSEEMYNAREAMGKLKLPITTFYRKVKEGAIPFKGQRPNMRFPKEAVDAIAEIELEDEPSKELIFDVSTVADTWARQEIMQQRHDYDGFVPFKTLLSWRKINEEISFQVKEGKKVLGWVAFFPLEEEVILELIEDKIKERDIPLQALREWDDPQLSVYIPTLKVFPSSNLKRDRAVASFLIRKSIKWALEQSAQHDIKNWYGVGTDPGGQALLEALGFEQINSLDGGKRKGYKLADMSKPSKLLKNFLRTVQY